LPRAGRSDEAWPDIAVLVDSLINAFAVPLLFMRLSLWGKNTWHMALFAILSLLADRLFESSIYQNLQVRLLAVRRWRQTVNVAWWMFFAMSGAVLRRLAFVTERPSRESRFNSGLLATAIYVTTILMIVDLAFRNPVAGVLATLGILATVLDSALKGEFLAIFSDFAVVVERPYKRGDLLWIEGGAEDHVPELTWRLAHISRHQNNIVVLPNIDIAKAYLVNHSLGFKILHDEIEFRLPPLMTPQLCSMMLKTALSACEPRLQS